MREYERIWTKLKCLPLREATLQGVSVTANRRLHKRIIKAVQKEKWLDIPYKMALDPMRIIMYHTRNNSILTFYLKVAETSIDSRNL